MTTEIDRDGQPSKNINWSYRLDRSFHEFVGFLEGIIASGDVEEAELESLYRYLNDGDNFANVSKNEDFRQLLDLIANVMEDNHLNKSEERLVFNAMKNIVNLPISSVREDSNAQRRNLQNRAIGYIKGILSSGYIDASEVANFLNFLNSKSEELTGFIFEQLRETLDEILEDGVVDFEEEKQLDDLFQSIIDRKIALTVPEPEILLTGKTFCVTGKSEQFKRAEIEQLITAHGGIAQKSITKKLDYLILCDKPSRDWKTSVAGNKINSAKDKNIPVISIISFLSTISRTDKI